MDDETRVFRKKVTMSSILVSQSSVLPTRRVGRGEGGDEMSFFPEPQKITLLIFREFLEAYDNPFDIAMNWKTQSFHLNLRYFLSLVATGTQ